MFKAVFTKNSPEFLAVLAKLLSAITGREVEAVSVIGNELTIDNLRGRQLRFDVYRKSSTGKYFNVELSKLKELVEKPVKEMTATERWAFYFRYINDREKQDKINWNWRRE